MAARFLGWERPPPGQDDGSIHRAVTTSPLGQRSAAACLYEFAPVRQSRSILGRAVPFAEVRWSIQHRPAEGPLAFSPQSNTAGSAPALMEYLALALFVVLGRTLPGFAAKDPPDTLHPGSGGAADGHIECCILPDHLLSTSHRTAGSSAMSTVPVLFLRCQAQYDTGQDSGSFSL